MLLFHLLYRLLLFSGFGNIKMCLSSVSGSLLSSLWSLLPSDLIAPWLWLASMCWLLLALSHTELQSYLVYCKSLQVVSLLFSTTEPESTFKGILTLVFLQFRLFTWPVWPYAPVMMNFTVIWTSLISQGLLNMVFLCLGCCAQTPTWLAASHHPVLSSDFTPLTVLL